MTEFIGRLPPDGGYHWYVDKEYPYPVIGYVSVGKFYDLRGNDLTAAVGRMIFIGPEIPQYPCKDVEIKHA